MTKAIISTAKGDMHVEFYDNDAPNTVANFVKGEFDIHFTQAFGMEGLIEDVHFTNGKFEASLWEE